MIWILVLFTGFVRISSTICGGKRHTDPEACSGHGECEESGCRCLQGFEGTLCETKITWMYLQGSYDGPGTFATGTLRQWGTGTSPKARQHSLLITSPLFPDSLFDFFGFKDGSEFEMVYQYSFSKGEWRWIAGESGNDPPVVRDGDGKSYSDTNRAGGRTCFYAWLSEDQRAVIFGGGYSHDGEPATLGIRNAIWMFNLTTFQWREIREDREPNFGIDGEFNNSVAPVRTANWIHQSGGVKRNGTRGLFFGGSDDWYGGGSTKYSNLYEFDEPSELFRHVKGPHAGDYVGDYFVKGEENKTFVPRSRGNHACWSPNENEFWIFGGTEFQLKHSNDLWRFRFSTNSWTWMSGEEPNDQGYSNPFPDQFHSSNFPESARTIGGSISLGTKYLLMAYPAQTATTFRNVLWVYSLHTNGWYLEYGNVSLDNPQTTIPNHMGSRAWGAMRKDYNHSGTFYFSSGKGYNSLGSISYVSDLYEGYVYFCFDIPRESSAVCSGHGKCVAVDLCDCFIGWNGTNCSNFLYLSCHGKAVEDPEACSGHGECVAQDSCMCENGWGNVDVSDCSVYYSFDLIFGEFNESVSSVYGCDTSSSVAGGRIQGCAYSFRNRESYVFGGSDLQGIVHFNDVWRWKDDSSTWCFVKGSNSSERNYTDNMVMDGPLLFHEDNVIGSRSSFGSFSTEFSFFVLGGEKFSRNETNELWEFSVIGKSTGHKWRVLFGHHEEISSNQPTPRSYLCAGRYGDDMDDDVFFFGGQQTSSEGQRTFFNDLWKYSILTNEFTKLRNGNRSVDEKTLFVLNQFSETNDPPHRILHSCWVDQNHEFYIFGGLFARNIETETQQYFGNDVWKFNQVNGTWGWIAGGKNNTVNEFNGEAESFVFHELNVPGVRHGMITFSNHLRFFSGETFFPFYGGRNKESIFGDMWAFSYVLRQFRLMNGTKNEVNQVRSSSNLGSRYFGMGFTEVSKSMLIWGGVSLS